MSPRSTSPSTGRWPATDSNGVDGWSFIWNTSPLSGGAYTLTATATDTAGQTDTDQVTVQVGTNSKGNWVGTYGVDGYLIGAWNAPSTDLSSLPAGVTSSLEQGTRYSWTTTTTTTDVRALQSPDQTERRATTWYDTTEVRVRLNFTNAYSGTLHLYAVDWNAIGRAENVIVDDGIGPRMVGLASFNNGAWVHVPITVGSGGSVLITAHNTAGTFNAVLNGVFLGGAGRRPHRLHRLLHPRRTTLASRATGSAPTASTATSSVPGMRRARTSRACPPA